jgi:hypothetical protein
MGKLCIIIQHTTLCTPYITFMLVSHTCIIVIVCTIYFQLKFVIFFSPYKLNLNLKFCMMMVDTATYIKIIISYIFLIIFIV